MQQIGIGIIGLGMAAKPHALALRDLGTRVRVLGGYSPTPERRREFEQTHAQLAIDAARAGKHVLLEKPIDVTFERAREVVDALERSERKLGVVFQYRFRPGTRALRELIAAGELGELLSVSASIRWWRSPEYFAQPGRGMMARDGGGVLLTQSIHTLDVMLHLAGPVQRVAAMCRTSPLRKIDTEDIGCAALQFRNGAVGVLDATTVAYPGYPERIDIAGTRGSAVLEAERLEVHRPSREVLRVEGALAGGGGADPMAFSHEPHRRLIEDFLDAVETGREPLSSGRSALAVHALIDATLRSAQDGAVVTVPL